MYAMCFKWFLYVMILIGIGFGRFPNIKHQRALKQALRLPKNRGNSSDDGTSNSGLWPSVFNLATKAIITANATCGERGHQEFCRLSETGKTRCGVCDKVNSDPNKRHSIEFAIDGTSRWWQSPALYYGEQYEYITVTVDFKQVYRIMSITIKAAISPRPGTWIIERSVDGKKYEPWQYFARNDKECVDKFGIIATKEKPHHSTERELICTSFHSKLLPLENGEIHIPIVESRFGHNEINPEFSNFITARYVRLRFMGLNGIHEPLPHWLSQDIWKDKKLFYSIRDIYIGGQCLCNGHASNCRHNVASGHPECECRHHTCGSNCEKCCPMFNQQLWGPGSLEDSKQCVPCNCHGHASSCHYDADIDKAKLSMNIHGKYQGGGVCDNCTDFTTGINCELCIPGYFRPSSPQSALQSCYPCRCEKTGTSTCDQYGENAGKCICLEGYSGEKCDQCAAQFTGWPKCEPCSCDPRGVSLSRACEKHCTCKTHVEGKYCDRCKSGYFGLRSDLAEGCFQCYCSDVTNLCESAVVHPRKIQFLNTWLMTDLRISRIAKPNWNGQSLFSLGNYEFPGVKSLYWLAPKEYLGNKLEAYNSEFIFKVQWVVMRGDTSGEPTRGPDMIIVGENGMKIGYGDKSYTTSKMTYHIKMIERNWYHMPDLNDITGESSNFERGKAVKRKQFLNVLKSIKHILLRSTFHTDQIESLLEFVVMEIIEEDAGYGGVEKCSCPSGYSGLSCESCSFGYVRKYDNSTNNEIGFCAKCDCNGHSETCDPDSGQCFCDHNTVGEKCERCAPGFYGNPLKSTPDDCKTCACPLENDGNNFSPSCQLDLLKLELGYGNYVCTQCPRGYTGDHCEICDDGYYGDPLEIGNSCKKCDCNGGPCHGRSGKCLSCKGNTEGWKCEKCKPDHYGDPLLSNCKACECDPIGSISKQCDILTGHCECKPKFIGRTCDRCRPGYGNITAFCKPCACNLVGSKTHVCDTQTGTCECHPGVEGFHCDACQNLYYGFSASGCQSCNCSPEGSKFTMCNVTSGQCVCRPHFIGRTCNLCEAGYWMNNKSCQKCVCNEYGSLNEKNCDRTSGKCFCRDGITGFHCDSCLSGYYGTIENGCKKCDDCERTGHLCDSINGNCVCPPLTEGTNCEKCTINSWGHKPNRGCQNCSCSSFGSINLQCDIIHGNCFCKEGYNGVKCDKCSFGYYGYPHCRKCTCDPKGTRVEDCTKDLCRCYDDGSCSCKENVQGKNCSLCKSGYFSLNENNHFGCINCFCFNRSTVCENAQLHWDKIRKDKFPAESNRIEKLDDIMMLPQNFLGDLTASYGGYLTVIVPGEIFEVYLEGNGVELHQLSRNTEVQLIESIRWQIRSHNYHLPQQCLKDFTRTCFMVVLQNITKIRVEAKSRIQEVLLDKTKSNIPNYPTSHTIERCKCPAEYSGLSCQSPNEGYYRYYPKEEEYNWIDKIIGISKLCECNNKSSQCDPSGRCKNCRDFTSGSSCETCIEGYYKDENGNCSACLCPSREQNNAKSCERTPKRFKCVCKKGYTGYKCEECDSNFFNNGTHCEPCNCSLSGTISERTCVNGTCHCKQGFKGDKCDRCNNDREFIQNGTCLACDECTQILFSDIYRLSSMFSTTSMMFENYISSSWMLLENNLIKYETLYENFSVAGKRLNELLHKSYLYETNGKIKKMQEEVEGMKKISENSIFKTNNLYKKTNEFVILTKNMNMNARGLFIDINNFGYANISLDEALKKANQTKTEIKYISETIDFLQNNTMLTICSRITEQMNIFYKYSSDISFQQFKHMDNIIEDLITVKAHIGTVLESASCLIHNNSHRLLELKNKLKYLNKEHELTTEELQWILEKHRYTHIIMNQLEQLYQNLKNISRIESKIIHSTMKMHLVNISEIEEIFFKSIEHVQDFENKVKNLISEFNFTKHEWQIINASSPYERIINGINEVKLKLQLSEVMIHNATKIIKPDDYDDITDKTNLAYAYSDRLKKRIDNFKSVSKDLNLIKNKLNDLKYTILLNGKSNNDLTQILHGMETEMTSQKNNMAQLEIVIVQNMEISNEMRKWEKKIESTLFDKEHIFFKEYQEFFNLTSPQGINNISNTLRLSRKRLQGLNISSTYVNSLDNLNQVKNHSGLSLLRGSLRNLHKKINYARQAADTINVPLSLTNCSMSYKLTKREYFRNVIITFKCHDCILFSWKKNSGGLFQIYHSKNCIKLNFDNQEVSVKTDSTGKESTVTISRIGPVIKVVSNGNDNSSKIGSHYNILDLDDIITVGGQTGFATTGYIYQILLNEKKFGLWNFRNTTGSCKGQKRDKSEAPETNHHIFFSDGGYKVYGINKQFVPRKLSLSFDIKTFDENSLIYLAVTEDCQQYIILYLENGYAKLTVLHGRTLENTQKSDNKVNDGRNYEIEITMNYKEKNPKHGEQQYNLIVRFQEKTIERQSNKISLNSSELVKIRRAQHYLGGVPPTFEKTCVKLNTITTSFLGYLKPKTPLTNENVSYGISLVSDKVLEYTYAWIHTNGVILLNIPNIEIVTLNFILKPIEPNGIVLKLNQDQIIYLENSKLALKNVDIVDSDEFFLKLNDYNDIQLALVEEKYISINGRKLNIPYFDKIFLDGYLQIGDLRTGFTGGIREIIINKHVLPFNPTTLYNFTNVDIGRDKEINIFHNSQVVKSLTVNPNFSNFMQNTEGCAVSKIYKIESNSVKFGDEQNSYVHIKMNFWKNDYILRMEFRTLYPNGLLFISSGFKQQNYIVLEIRNSKIHLTIRGKKKNVPVVFNRKVDDGRWHKVQLNKKKRKLLVILDTSIKKPIRIPKITVRNEIYFGGVPQKSDMFKIFFLKGKLRPFHGCMRYLAINEESQFLEEKRYDHEVFFSNTGQCFTNIEDGAYFEGNGYAIYDKHYLVRDIFEVSFEFRTTEQNGIIFIISEPKNSPAFSLELQNGALVMAVDTGNDAIIYASNNLDSDFALCNNHWHNVSTLFSNSELTVTVDGIRKTWVQPESNSVFDKYEAALYIGGIPLNAPTGTLRVKENFSGCLRKFKIGNISVDWSEVNELNNVSLNSCPPI